MTEQGRELVCVWWEPASPEDADCRYSVTIETAHSLSQNMREWKCEPSSISTISHRGELVPVTLHSPVYYSEPGQGEPLAYCPLTADTGNGAERVGAVNIYGKTHREVRAALLREDRQH